MRIKDGGASIPGDGIEIDGGVSAGGAVRATIVERSIRVPITGRLDPKGTGSGTWRSTGDSLFTCSGSWNACGAAPGRRKLACGEGWRPGVRNPQTAPEQPRKGARQRLEVSI